MKQACPKSFAQIILDENFFIRMQSILWIDSKADSTIPFPLPIIILNLRS
jgi:hypothetical protein